MQAFDGQTDGQTDFDSKTVSMHSQSHDKKSNIVITEIRCSVHQQHTGRMPSTFDGRPNKGHQ